MSKSVFVVGRDFLVRKMFLDNGWLGAATPAEADLICFTGGEDVDPSLYGEAKHKTTYSNIDRDRRETTVYEMFGETPKVGICRGGQFLNVMNGGSMWQDVSRHGRAHDVIVAGDAFFCSSTHHQMMIPGSGGLVVGTAHECDRKEKHGVRVEGPGVDVEIVYYPETQSLCFQPHPEYEGYLECTQLFFELVDQLIKQGEELCAA